MTVGIMVVFCGLSAILTRKKHKDTFSFIVLFCEEKYQKSARRTRAVLLPNLSAARDKSKVAVLPLSAVLTIPRERTYHTKKPSRFVHALSARPLKVQGGRGSNMRADGTIKISPISLCSHPDPHHYFDHPVSATPTAFACANRSIPARFAIA